MKKTNLLMPLLGVGALAGTIVPCTVSCGTNTPDEPTEEPEMIITKSSDTVTSSRPITITVTSTTQGMIEITSVELDDDDLSATINDNKIVVTANLSGHLINPLACSVSISASCDGTQMKKQIVAIVLSSDDNYDLLPTAGYAEENNTIYTQRTKEIAPEDTKHLAIEYDLSKFKSDENLKNANSYIYFSLPKNTTWEIGMEVTHFNEWCSLLYDDGQREGINYACETILDSSGNFQFYYINVQTIKDECQHNLSIGDTIYLFVQIKNTGTEPGSISTMYN